MASHEGHWFFVSAAVTGILQSGWLNKQLTLMCHRSGGRQVHREGSGRCRVLVLVLGRLFQGCSQMAEGTRGPSGVSFVGSPVPSLRAPPSRPLSTPQRPRLVSTGGGTQNSVLAVFMLFHAKKFGSVLQRELMGVRKQGSAH